MASHVLASLRSASARISTRLQSRSCILATATSFSNGFVSASLVQSMSTTTQCDESVARRSANYEPPIWTYDYVQSLRNPYAGGSYAKRIEKLKGDVRVMLQKLVDLDPLHQLEFIDTLQRLGVSYHYQEGIKGILDTVYNNYMQKQESLYAVALGFRLFRQHGYHIPADIFSSFRDDKGNLKSCLGDDCRGILALYEAAHLLVEEERDIFYEIVNFTTAYLKEYVKHDNDEYLSALVNHSLEIPLHWRVLRLEARWFIGAYERAPNTHPILLEFAKLDFNDVQATHQEDLKFMSRWWKNTGLDREKMNFARDRIVQNVLWSLGIIFEPQFAYCRRMSVKAYAFITLIDDVYDVYGTLDELELFTDAVDRWDATAIEKLPDYMKPIFRTLYTSINDMALDARKDRGVDTRPFLHKAWSTLFNYYLMEAKWFSNGYMPTYKEYMDIAWFSVGGPVMIVHSYCAIANPATKENMEFFQEYYDIIRLCSTILRFKDDMGTSSDELKRGDNPKSIQCYMHESGVSEKEARQHLGNLITETWMKVNKNRAENPHLSDVYMGIAINMARMALCMYQFGDGHAVEAHSKDRVLSLLINPIPCP
nr:+limonene synthase [Toona sinensis]